VINAARAISLFQYPTKPQLTAIESSFPSLLYIIFYSSGMLEEITKKIIIFYMHMCMLLTIANNYYSLPILISEYPQETPVTTLESCLPSLADPT